MTSIITTIQPKILAVTHGHTPRSQVQKLAKAFLKRVNVTLLGNCGNFSHADHQFSIRKSL